MSKKSSKSHLAEVLTPGDGGLSDPKAQLQPLQSLAQDESQRPSSALAQQGKPSPFTHHGKLQLSNGSENALTAQKELTTPKLTLAGTLNWALIGLQRAGLVDIVLNTDANRYEIHLPVSAWTLENDLLMLSESEN